SGGPHLGERRFNIGDGRAADFSACVAPRIQTSRQLTRPSLTHAQASNEGHGAIDDDRFPVIAAEPAQRTVEPGWVIAAHVNGAGTKPVPEGARRLAESSHPVVEQAHLDALSSFPEERLREQSALDILVDDVHLKVNGPLSIINGTKPGGIILRSVLEQDDAIAVAQRCARSARKDLICPFGNGRELRGDIGASVGHRSSPKPLNGALT